MPTEEDDAVNMRECSECGVFVSEQRMQPVVVKGTVYRHTFYYCRNHTKPYDEVRRGLYGGVAYLRMMPVTEDGALIEEIAG